MLLIRWGQDRPHVGLQAITDPVARESVRPKIEVARQLAVDALGAYGMSIDDSRYAYFYLGKGANFNRGIFAEASTAKTSHYFLTSRQLAGRLAIPYLGLKMLHEQVHNSRSQVVAEGTWGELAATEGIAIAIERDARATGLIPCKVKSGDSLVESVDALLTRAKRALSNRLVNDMQTSLSDYAASCYWLEQVKSCGIRRIDVGGVLAVQAALACGAELAELWELPTTQVLGHAQQSA